MAETYLIRHPKYGEYVQTVYDTVEEAGYKKLFSGGKYGWNMPSDLPTQEFVKQTRGKVVLEIGTGSGEAIALPALLQGVTLFFAADITPEHIGAESLLQETARHNGTLGKLRPLLLDEDWWDRNLQPNPDIPSLLGRSETGNMPDDSSVDLMIARHSLQFGSPSAMMGVLDLASVALKEKGMFIGINFSPFTGYMFHFDDGSTIKKMMDLNKRFEAGELDQPGGFLHPEKGLIPVSLAQLMSKPELDRRERNSFLYFDNATIKGLLRLWDETRKMRNLAVDLYLEESFYFTPSSIARINKFDLVDTDLAEKENHVFIFRKKERASKIIEATDSISDHVKMIGDVVGEFKSRFGVEAVMG